MERKNLGDYVLLESKGQGTLGSSYVAEHKFTKKRVFVKIFPEKLSTNASFIRRFEEEVVHLSRLQHQNIVAIHNVSFDQGKYFLVTDEAGSNQFVNLSDFLLQQKDPLKEQTIFKILLQVASALDYAHHQALPGRPIPHRGLKPNNILIRQDRTDLKILITDFGITKILGVGPYLVQTMHHVGTQLGIPLPKLGANYPYAALLAEDSQIGALQSSFMQSFAFLSPEQKRSISSEPITYKSDIYSFGILAYSLLMGVTPEGIFDMPSQRLTQSKIDWDSLINSCLHMSQRKRPKSLMSLLKQIMRGKETLAKAESQVELLVEKDREEEKAPLYQTQFQPAQTQKHLRPILNTQQLDRPSHDMDPGISLQVDTSVKQYTPELAIVEREPILTEMVVIEGGTFYRGSDEGLRDESPRHTIEISSFAIDIHPVTNEQFLRFLEVMGGEKDRHHRDMIRLKESRIKRVGGKISIESGYGKHPVVGVTWYGAVAYAKWIGKRLPTEAEWEVASCGGDPNFLYPTGDTIERNQANFFSNDTTPVKSYPPNSCGLYDMAGNVYEWCQDWYDYNYYQTSAQEPYHPLGPKQGVYRVLRGGCWKSLREDLSCTKRHRNNPGTYNGTYGFRCATHVE